MQSWAKREHSGAVTSEHLWIVDPLDGTNNFAHRIPHFAVSIAYYHQQVAQCGVVVNPVRGDWYWATRGGGAFFNGTRLQVNDHQQLNQTMVGVGFYYDRGKMMEATLAAIGDFFRQQIHGVRRFGTAALDLCQVAAGMYGVFFEYQLSPWDFAAGRLILEEAGGQITDGRGQPLPLQKTSLLASNGHLHPAALESFVSTTISETLMRVLQARPTGNYTRRHEYQRHRLSADHGQFRSSVIARRRLEKLR